MRINERQQNLTDGKVWLSICEESINKFHKDILVNGDIRYIAKEPIEHGEWIIHSITISASPWACISDNVEYIAKKQANKLAHNLRLDLKYIIKPLLELISLHGSSNYKFSTSMAISGEELIHLLRLNEIDIPLKTWGFIKNKLAHIQRTATGFRYSSYGNYKGETVFELYKKLENKIQALADIALEELDAINNPDNYVSEAELNKLFGRAA